MQGCLKAHLVSCSIMQVGCQQIVSNHQHGWEKGQVHLVAVCHALHWMSSLATVWVFHQRLSDVESCAFEAAAELFSDLQQRDVMQEPAATLSHRPKDRK